MKLSDLLQERRDQLDKPWRQLEREYGFAEGTLRRLGKGESYPTMHPATLQKIAELLCVRPVTVILAHAEENGVYDPTQDGVLSRMGLPTSLVKAARTLQAELDLYIGEA